MIDNKIQSLFSSLALIDGVGTKTVECFKRLNCNKIIDLVWHLPSNIIKKQLNPNLKFIQDGTYIICEVSIEEIDLPRKTASRNKPFKIYASNETGFIELIFFNYYPSYLLKYSNNISKVTISGKVERFGGKIQIAHPQIINSKNFELVEIIYPLTYGINNTSLAKLIVKALGKLPQFPEWITEKTLKYHNWLSFDESIKKIHNPKDIQDLAPNKIERKRLAYDEFLANQLYLGLIRIHRNKVDGYSFDFKEELLKKLLLGLSFELTNGQKEILSEIIKDQKSNFKMMRLLQGDVGSGKTIIALAAAVNIVESGYQVAIMAPTDILATQHYSSIAEMVKNLDVKIELLTGKIKGKKREALLEKLQNGEIDILIGTHALFQEKVKFKKLGFVVIDEQHRFGVEQRILLAQKGENPDVLFMSATPIPRTLTLAISGDMDISRLIDKPKGRLPIKTSLLSKDKIDDLIESLRKNLNAGVKVYWICPLVEEQDKDSESFTKDIAAAIARYNEFSSLFSGKVGLIHGKMKTAEKDQAMLEFLNGDIQLLVATTVIEVGIDVRDATIIIIEQAERFGLSQLHQLRGRVGRGSSESYCILLYDTPISNSARLKLNIMKETENGFLIAEEDLKIRGAGEILGTKQSGLIRFKVADIENHQDLFYLAAADANEILNNDPKLTSERGKALRILLRIFEYNDKVDFLFG